MTYGKVVAVIFGSVLAILAIAIAAGQTSLHQRYTQNGSFQSSFGSAWIAAIESTSSTTYTGKGAELQDAATIDNPDADITTDTRLEFNRDGNPDSASNPTMKLQGTYLMFCFEYSADNTVWSADPVAVVFGRFDDPATTSDDDDDHWMPLVALNGSKTLTFADDQTNDVTDGTLRWTTPNYDSHVVDVAGCNVFKVGITTAFNANGTLTTCRVLVKGI